MFPSLNAARSIDTTTALILSAYQGRHGLPDQAARALGQSIAVTLTDLARRPAGAANVAATLPAKPARKPRRTAAAMTLDLFATRDEDALAPAEQDAVPVALTEGDHAADIIAAEAAPEPITIVEAVKFAQPDLPQVEDDEQDQEAADAAPTKRKRPSRPRSRRGNRQSADLG